MNVIKAITLKVMSALLFAVMSALVRFLGETYPVGQIVFFRSAFAILPVLVIYAWRNELAAAVRTVRPLGQIGRGLISICGMFCNFAALARLPIVDATAISFVSPLITVAMSALFLKERVRIYRWLAVIAGFVGILVMLGPHFDLSAHAGAAGTTLGLAFAIGGAFCNAGSVIQTRRLTETETTSSIVFYFSLICALAGLATRPLGWLVPTWVEFAALVTVGLRGGPAHIPLTEATACARVRGGAVRPYGDGGSVLLGYFFFNGADDLRLYRRRDHRGSWAFLVWPTSTRSAAHARGRGPAHRHVALADNAPRQNALKVMMVRVSWMPGMVCTFSLTKWPMSVLSST
jgi:drug/metabolite transporter (DMT)-like permease